MNKCLCCNQKTSNPKFCSKSCAAKINNKHFPKRILEAQNKCLSCGKRCSRRKGSRKTQLCVACYFNQQIMLYGKRTKKESIEEASLCASKHRYEKIRQHAKRLVSMMNWKKESCEKCGYDKHTELCHIKPISLFSDETTVATINSKQNIIFLCPNCHWELDNT